MRRTLRSAWAPVFADIRCGLLRSIVAAQVAGQPYIRHREKRYRRKDGDVIIWTEVDAFL
jgi:hypothetical protein